MGLLGIMMALAPTRLRLGSFTKTTTVVIIIIINHCNNENLRRFQEKKNLDTSPFNHTAERALTDGIFFWN